MLQRLLPLKVENILLQSHLILMFGSCSSCPVLILLHTSIFLILLKVLAIISFTHSSGDGSLTYFSHFWSIFFLLSMSPPLIVYNLSIGTLFVLLILLSFCAYFLYLCCSLLSVFHRLFIRPFLFSLLAFVFHFYV